MERFEIIQTSDGSYTIKDNVFNETFHSVQGAYNESMHVFFNQGLLLFKNEKSINIFEMGFGTGLNALLTLINKPESQIIYYETIDMFPLPNGIFENLTNQFSDNKIKSFLKKILDIPWNKTIFITDNFIIRKICADIVTYKFDCLIDLIYFDPFSFKSQPELWSEGVFKKLYNALKPNGYLVTYACNRFAKNNLINVGFEIERLKGAINKKHMLRAKKQQQNN